MTLQRAILSLASRYYWRKTMKAFAQRIEARQAHHQPICDIVAERKAFTTAALRGGR